MNPPDPITRLNAALEGRYRIESELGEGGMATVYLADDIKHERKVALKVLKPELAAVVGAERFLAEIKTTANLQHPHILPLFDSGEADSFLFYVMPYVEGETLRDRLEREKQLPVDEAVRIATDVAEALHSAHKQGVIHRDVKPANILLSEGRPLVADFGIALAVSAAGGGRLTETGLSVGTPYYMSPEQASADREPTPASDVYSLGCVLYEMLVGQPPHTGASSQAVLAKILMGEAPSAAEGRASIPPHVDAAVGKALERLSADRFASAQEFGRALADPAFRRGASGERALVVGSRWWKRMTILGWTTAGITATLLAGLVLRGSPEASAPLLRFDVDFPEGFEPGGGSPPVAVSPDGSALLYSLQSGGVTHLFKRRLDEIEAVQVEGTEGAHTPFFSPDGQWIGFVADRTISTVNVTGGAPRVVGQAPFVSLGATWVPGTIVFGGIGTGLLRIPEAGGEAEPLTELDQEQGDYSHGWPTVLPGGRQIMFTVGTAAGPRTAVVSLDTGERRRIEGIDGGSGARYLPSGHLVFSSSEELFAVPFDADRLTVRGSPISVQRGIYAYRSATFATFSYFDVSASGTLAFIPGGGSATSNVLAWVDRDGSSTPVAAYRGSHFYPHVSPNGQLIAVQEGNEIWVYDAERGTRSRLTTGGGTDPVWTPDGERIAFSAAAGGRMSLFLMPLDGSEESELLLTRENPIFPHSWSPDGTTLAFYEVSPGQARDIWVLVEGVQGWEAQPFLATAANERAPAFSPDGRWIAYMSDESGRDEIYVQPYPGPGGKIPISREGGREPVWSSDGAELYYRQGDRIVALPVNSADGFSAGEPTALFSGGSPQYFSASGSQTYDVAPGGRRFVMPVASDVPIPRKINLVVNWLRELTELVPPR